MGWRWRCARAWPCATWRWSSSIRPDCWQGRTPEWPGLFVAGEDASGMHGANRLGGNGVANSTVFGGIAGDVMPRFVAASGGHRAPDESVLDAEIARALHPFVRKAGNLNDLREKLLDTMWNDG